VDYNYRLPWEEEVVVTDGVSCGFPAPTRMFINDATE
jgi:formamidase